MQLISKLTIGIIITVTVLLIGYDIIVATNSVNNAVDTLSGRIKIWALETPIISWCWCGLAGHFFGPFSPGQFISFKIGIGILILLTWSLMILGLILRSKGITIPPWSIAIPAFLAGSILWAQ